MSSPLIPFNIEGSEDPAFMREVAVELQLLVAQEAEQAGRQQEAIARHNWSHAPQRAVDGLGPLTLSMAPAAHLFYRLQGFDFQSKKDVQWLTQRHPEMKVHGRETTKDQFGYRGPVQEWPVAPAALRPESTRSASVSTISSTPERNVRETTTYTS
jgi:hypothetical protein